MRSLIAVIRAFISRTKFEHEMREELRAHVELRADDLAAQGLSREEARRRARIEFGATETYKEQCRDAGGFAPLRPWHGLGADLRLAIRRLAATPVFTVFAVLSLAVGLGVTTAAYSVVATLFFGSTGIREEERVVSVMTVWDGRRVDGGMSAGDVEDIRTAAKSFASLSAYTTFSPAVATAAGTDLMRAEAVDAAYFSTLGVQTVLGRALDARDVAEALPVVVVSHSLWSRRFAADPALIGRAIRIAGRTFEVVGIAPRDFHGFGERLAGTRIWIPLSADPRRSAALNDRDRPRLIAFGRLAEGVALPMASAELAALGAGIDAGNPRASHHPGPRRRAWSARPIADGRRGEAIMQRFGIVFIALVALVLVVACTNLANLVLARGTTRQQEFAVRRAIGASRWRLVREQLAESLVLAVLGAGAGWLVFAALSVALDIDLPIGGKMLISFAPTFDPAILAVAAASLFLSLLVFGLEPALQLTRDRGLRDELAATAGSVGVPRAKRQQTLVRWQVAISTGFFIMATLCVKYTIAEARHDSGVDLDRLAVATMNFSAQQWDDVRARRALARLLEEIEKDPVVESAAVSTGVPFGTTNAPPFKMSTTDKPITEHGTFPWGPAVIGTPRFFRTMGIRIVRGRAFDARDDASAPPVIVISERTALALFGTSDAVGREMLIKPLFAGQPARSVAQKLALPTAQTQPAQPNAVRTVMIVGVAANTDVVHLFSDKGHVAYLPFEQQTGRIGFGMALVRTAGDPYLGVRAVREAIGRADPDLAVESSGTGLGMLGGPTLFLRTATMFAVALGALTLLLAMVGLYGVQSHGVSHRTREIGVRMSFGATAAQIRALVLKDGYRPVLQGIAIGIFIGFAGRGIVRAFLWDKIELVDPWMFLAVPVPLLLAAFFACYWPARRAARVDPNVALRHL